MCFWNRKKEEYGMPLFHDIDYNPTYSIKPFTPTKCTRTIREHYRIVKYYIACNNCQLRKAGERSDDICKCQTNT